MATRWAVEDGQTGAGFIPRWTVRDPLECLIVFFSLS